MVKKVLSKKMMKMMKISLVVVVLAVGVFLAIRYFRKSNFDPEPSCAPYREDNKSTDFTPEEDKFINWIFCDATSKEFFDGGECDPKKILNYEDKKKCYEDLERQRKIALQVLYCDSAGISAGKYFNQKKAPNSSVGFKCVVSHENHHLGSSSSGDVSHNNRHTEEYHHL